MSGLVTQSTVHTLCALIPTKWIRFKINSRFIHNEKIKQKNCMIFELNWIINLYFLINFILVCSTKYLIYVMWMLNGQDNGCNSHCMEEWRNEEDEMAEFIMWCGIPISQHVNCLEPRSVTFQLITHSVYEFQRFDCG